jgi:lysophospholipase L1-like esterase
MKILLTLMLIGVAATAARAAPLLDLHDNDRIVFVGSTLIEREQERGFIETMLVSRFPAKHLMFRNVGYSGDTVSGEARGLCTGWSTFESAQQGQMRLRKIIREIQPTVLIVSYGSNESFNGPAKLDDFISGYNMLLDMLADDAKAGAAPGLRQVLLISPNYHEDLGRPLPDPAEHNQNLKIYCDTIKEMAAKRGCAYVDLFSITKDLAAKDHLTSNGIHLTAYGYWRVALSLEEALGLGPRVVSVTVPQEASDFPLPSPPPPAGSPTAAGAGEIVKLANGSNESKSGSLRLQINGSAVGKVAPVQEWMSGVFVEGGPAVEQAEKLRQLIVAKNFDFFNYFRPENDSYILSFRRNEQGKNAVEIPEFKPIAAQKDAQIEKLSVPKNITISLK